MTVRSGRLRTEIALLLARIGLVVVLVLLWFVAAEHQWINDNFFSAPLDVWKSMTSLSSNGELWQALQSTVIVLAVGWIIGELLGLTLGVMLGLSPTLNAILGPIVVFANAVPRILLLPIFVVWYGFGYTPKVLLVVAVMVVFVALNVAAGVREVEGLLVDNMRMHGAGKLDVLRHGYLPAVALWVTSSARVTVGYALQAAIGSELLGAHSGLGGLISSGQVSFKSDQIIAVLFVAAALAIAIDLLLGTLERRAIQWMPT
ncbi:ABC transporter permease [Mycobacterium sp. NPDC003449]